MHPDPDEEILDLSRTEQLVTALAEALQARQNIQDVHHRYTTFNSHVSGEPPLADALREPTRVYVEKLDVLRGVLRHLGLPS